MNMTKTWKEEIVTIPLTDGDEMTIGWIQKKFEFSKYAKKFITILKDFLSSHGEGALETL